MIKNQKSTLLDDLDSIKAESVNVYDDAVKSQHLRNSIKPGDVEGKKMEEIVVEKNGEEKKYQIEVLSDSMSLNELITILVTGTGISFTSIVDVPSLYVSIQGEYTLDEIIELIKRVCGEVGYSFVRSGNICTVEKVQDGVVSSMSVMGYRCKYVIPSNTELETLTGKTKNVFVYVKGMNVIAIGQKSDIGVIKEFIEAFDKDIFEGYKISFVTTPDVDITAEKIKAILASLSPEAINHVNVIPISESVICLISQVPEYVEMVKTVVGMMSGYMKRDKEIFIIPVSYKKSTDALEFVKKTFPDYQVSADDEVNRLYVKGSVYDYQAVKRLMEGYDIQPEQIMFKVYLIDVKSNNNLDMGSDWFVDAENYRLNQSDLIFPLSGGFNSILSIGNAKSFFSMLQTKFDAKVVSRPILYMKSGQSSEVKFGSSVPFVNTKAATNIANGVVQNVSYRDVGIILKITASVAENKNVLVDVYIENSALVSDSGVEGNPVFTNDSVKSVFVIPNGSICILGGVKNSNKQETKKGVPYVNYIPFLNYIIGSVRKTFENRELIICVCPSVISVDKVSTIGEKILKNFNYRGCSYGSQN